MPTTVKHKPASGAGVPGSRGRKIIASCDINKSPAEVFRFWRHLENLPRFSRYLVSITQTSDANSHWIARSPAGGTLEWDAVILNEHPDQLISWESLPGAGIQNAGTIRFEPAPGDLGTHVTVTLEYVPPGGTLGAAISRIYGGNAQQQLQEELMRFRTVVESGASTK